MVTLDVSLLFQLAITLMCLTESRKVPCRAVINQLEEVRVQTSVRTTTLPCYVNYLCRSGTLHVRWFVFRRDTHHEIQTQTAKYSMNGQNLTIHFLLANDSGVYYCTVFSSKIVPGIGNGTRLVVRGRPTNTTKQALLWTLFAVLAVYSAVILMLLVSKKARREIFRSKRSSTERGSTRRQHFHAVVQELYSQGNLSSTGRNSDYANQRRSP